MKVGLQLYHFHWPGSPNDIGDRVREIAKAAEQGGFSSIWIMDHFYQLDRGFGPTDAVRYDRPTMEAYSTLSYLAGVTKKVKLGALVTGNIYRFPGILVKNVTTLDILSGGRAYLGIGAGWYGQEARGLGVPFPESPSERLGRLTETLKIAKQMWKGDTSPFIGKYYQLDHPLCNPQPLSKPHPPILIGGDGERTLLRLVAKYADACNFHIGGPLLDYPQVTRDWYINRIQRISRKISKLDVYCKEFGRAIEDVEVTVLATIKVGENAMSTNEITNLCREMHGIGVDHIIFNMPDAHEIIPVEAIGDNVIPNVSDL